MMMVEAVVVSMLQVELMVIMRVIRMVLKEMLLFRDTSNYL